MGGALNAVPELAPRSRAAVMAQSATPSRMTRTYHALGGRVK
jgi:hypothetical protein